MKLRIVIIEPALLVADPMLEILYLLEKIFFVFFDRVLPRSEQLLFFR